MRGVVGWWDVIGGLWVLALAGLGVWQLERLEWKEGLIEAMTLRGNEEATLFPPVGRGVGWGADWEEWEWRRVKLEGRWTGRALYLSEATQGGWRYKGLMFLELSRGGAMLVDMGYLGEPRGLALSGEVSLEGVVRRGGEGRWYDGGELSQGDVWRVADIEAMATAAGVEGAAPFMLEKTESGERWVGVELRNEHLGYALTWFALSAGCLVVWALRRRAGRMGDAL